MGLPITGSFVYWCSRAERRSAAGKDRESHGDTSSPTVRMAASPSSKRLLFLANGKLTTLKADPMGKIPNWIEIVDLP
jgi:hypothetical protein